jgi:predicted DNA-binding transcriptional regulator YafY
MKFDRLLGITLELLTKRKVTATELASKFEVSVRTIYRDMDLINQAGIPIASTSGSNGGFELMNGFFLTKQHFSVEDFALLYHFFKSIEKSSGTQRFSVLANKLSTLQPALLNENRHEKIMFDIGVSEKEKRALNKIMQAIDDSNRVEIDYRNAKGEVSKRKIEPTQLLWEQGVWYLDSYCLLRNGNRYFRVSRIETIEVLNETFPSRTVHENDEEPETVTQEINVHLRFDPNVHYLVLDHFSEEFTVHKDYIDVQTRFYSTEHAVMTILGYGDKVKIISPDEIRTAFLATLKRIKRMYD